MFKRKNPRAERSPDGQHAVKMSIDLQRSPPYEHYDRTGGGSASSPAARAAAPSRPPRTGLPSLPAEFVAQGANFGRRKSSFQPTTTTSPSSPPSHQHPALRAPSSAAGSMTSGRSEREDDFAPASPSISPQTTRQSLSSQRSVSPIEDMPDIAHLHLAGPPPPTPIHKHQAVSSIPVLRREKRREQVASIAANFKLRREADGIRSAVDSPSPDGDDTMKTRQYAAPAPRIIHGPTGLPLGNDTNVEGAIGPRPPEKDYHGGAQVNTSFGERIKKLKLKNGKEDRPAWKGASGRQSIVAPMTDRRDMPPLRMPAKTSSNHHSASPTPVSATRRGAFETGYVAAFATDPASRAMSPLGNGYSPRSMPNAPEAFYTPVRGSPGDSPRTQSRSRDAPVPVHHTNLTPSATAIERNFHEALKIAGFPMGEVDPHYVPPPSRFSVTTYAPSVSEAPHSPQASFDNFSFDATTTTPPVPQLPFPIDASTPILNRRRPRYASESVASVKATTRKPLARGSTIHLNMRSSIANNPPGAAASPFSTPTASFRPATATSVDALSPLSPATSTSHEDACKALQVQLDRLQRRKRDIAQAIRQLTELMPTDALVVTDMVRRKRDDEKQVLERLRQDEADVRREEHDVGLRLHRAWKRRDRESHWEATGLWVRRVTE